MAVQGDSAAPAAGTGGCLAAFDGGSAPPADWAAALASTAGPVQEVRLSALEAPDQTPAPARGCGCGACVVHQDLPVERLLECGEDLVGRLVYPCYLRGRPLFFHSVLPRSAYLGHVHSSDLHTDLSRLRRALAAEQLVDLLEVMGPPNSAAPRGGPTPRPKGGAPLPVDPGLDANQQRAARHMDGPIRVLAPAGSGKTKTLINRIAHLLNEGVPPDAVLALAFNRKAALEMQERLAASGVPVAETMACGGAVVRTFHSLGYEIVRDHLGWRVDEESTSGTTVRRLRQAWDDLHQHVTGGARVSSRWLTEALTQVRMDLVPLDQVSAVSRGAPKPFGPVFERYLQIQAGCRTVDFDDMVYLSLRALLDSRPLRRRLRDRFRYVLVDEFQDLNRAQMLLVQVLAMPRQNLFAVGDDDQLIYGWRGAQVRHILDFARTFPASEDCLLSTNYRSSRAVVRHARWLIDHNQQRVAKDIQPRPGAEEGRLDLFLGESLADQAEAAGAWLAERAPRWGRSAVLFRRRVDQYTVAAALDRAGVPHVPVDTDGLFHGNVGRDLQSYLRVLLPGAAATARDFATVLQRPTRLLDGSRARGVSTWRDLLACVRMPGLAPEQAEKLAAALSTLSQLRAAAERDPPAADLVTAIARETGLAELYRNGTRCRGAGAAAGDEALLAALVGVAATAGSGSRLLHRMETVRRVDEAGEEGVPQAADGVALSTIHSTKGNEYDCVVYFNVAGGRGRGAAEIEEERRVAYVALTRAVDSILVTAPRGACSPFVRELALNPACGQMSAFGLAARLCWRRACRWGLGASRAAAAGRAGEASSPTAADLQVEWRHRRSLRRAAFELPPADGGDRPGPGRPDLPD